MSLKYKVTVIVPIYKVECFIERCVTSLMKQTLREVEYLFIDDASPDRSIQLLEGVLRQFPNRKDNVRIVHHDCNKGLPAARNTGLLKSHGQYVFHCDSDDYVEPNMLEELYKAAECQNSDIVWCDWYLSYASAERYMKQPSFDNPMDALKAMLGGAMKFNVWNKLVRRSLYTENDIVFPAGYGMGEDMTMMMLFVHARKITYVPKAYYHYVKTNANAFSQTYSDKHLNDLRYNVKRISEFMQKQYGDSLMKELNFLKLEVKFPFLVANNFRRWIEWYPEANDYILQNMYIPNRSRWIQWLAAKRQFWIVWLYNQILNRVIYGMIYK